VAAAPEQCSRCHCQQHQQQQEKQLMCQRHISSYTGGASTVASQQQQQHTSAYPATDMRMHGLPTGEHVGS